MGSGMTWPEFQWLLFGLLGCESRLLRLFVKPKPDTQPEG